MSTKIAAPAGTDAAWIQKTIESGIHIPKVRLPHFSQKEKR